MIAVRGHEEFLVVGEISADLDDALWRRAKNPLAEAADPPPDQPLLRLNLRPAHHAGASIGQPSTTLAMTVAGINRPSSDLHAREQGPSRGEQARASGMKRERSSSGCGRSRDDEGRRTEDRERERGQGDWVDRHKGRRNESRERGRGERADRHKSRRSESGERGRGERADHHKSRRSESGERGRGERADREYCRG